MTGKYSALYLVMKKVNYTSRPDANLKPHVTFVYAVSSRQMSEIKCPQAHLGGKGLD